ncbi:toxin-antitoxin system HicB family antitoxin [Porphyrobacter sp. TH134]|uniref:toxin-antitoxin system HicB family antitoxin n=1 Tax=Porphyrobacter sp. TH134 TaxID=2067450 RepID=UPI000C7E3580|nr:toxin-antitoxin system HicB family antitoxin [Porphyrobacter sp. TH134]PLK23478.1 toxin-antitoxin system HicB family antitoxin [Porphyrobacter sp. TH134]
MPARKAFPLRLDPALHDAVQRLADADLRSVNAEIEVLLREALARRGVKVGKSEAVRRGRPPGAATRGTSDA